MTTFLDDLAAMEIFNEEGAPLKDRFHLTREEPEDSKITLIIGENGSGKSLVRRAVMALCEDHEEIKECIHLSMSQRTTACIMRALTYGDDSRQSTGAGSLHVVKTCINTSNSRNHKHVIVLDEPDIGASPRLAATMGRLLGEWVLPESLVQLFIVTHSRELVDELADRRGVNNIYMGKKPIELFEWMGSIDTPMSDEEVDRFEADTLALFRAMQKWIEKIQKENSGRT